MNQLFLQGEPELELNKTFIVSIRTLCHAHVYEIVEGSPATVVLFQLLVASA